jgi:hypothetical protein
MEASAQLHCLNCATELQGRYCHHCGQPGKGSLYSVIEVATETLVELVSLDGKLIRTLKLLFVPGALTREYIGGRRVRYASPVRLYLFSSLLLFAVISLFHPGRLARAVGWARPPAKPIATELVAPKTDRYAEAQSKMTPAERAVERLRADRLAESKTVVFLAVPPVFALVLMAAYRRSQRYYVAHLFLALHLQAFVFSGLALLVVAARLLSFALRLNLSSHARQLVLGGPVLIGIAVAAIVYLVIAARRVYRVSWLSATLKGLPLVIGYAATMLILGVVANQIIRIFG